MKKAREDACARKPYWLRLYEVVPEKEGNVNLKIVPREHEGKVGYERRSLLCTAAAKKTS